MIFAHDEKLPRWWLKWTGSSSWWTFLMYIVQFVDGTVMFGVILLIGTGWSFLKPYLHAREKKLLMTVLPMQVWCHIRTPMPQTSLDITLSVTIRLRLRLS